MPIATILVIWACITTAESLASKRPYIIVIAFVVGMLLTPPDVISQTLLALPMWLLFELGLVMSKLYTKKTDAEESSENPEPETAANSTAHNSATQTAATASSVNSETTVTETAVDEQYRPLSEDEMDAELDRIEAAEKEGAGDNKLQEDIADSLEGEGEPHPEFEPISEEEARRLDHPEEYPDKEENPEIVMENVSQLELIDEGIKISTLFEEPKIIADVQVTRIDFMNGKVFLGSSK